MSENRLKQFADYLARSGRQMTQERRTVAQVMFARSAPFDADTLVEAVQNDSTPNRISRATIYRILNQLERSGLVRFDVD